MLTSRSVFYHYKDVMETNSAMMVVMNGNVQKRTKVRVLPMREPRKILVSPSLASGQDRGPRKAVGSVQGTTLLVRTNNVFFRNINVMAKKDCTDNSDEVDCIKKEYHPPMEGEEEEMESGFKPPSRKHLDKTIPDLKKAGEKARDEEDTAEEGEEVKKEDTESEESKTTKDQPKTTKDHPIPTTDQSKTTEDQSKDQIKEEETCSSTDADTCKAPDEPTEQKYTQADHKID